MTEAKLFGLVAATARRLLQNAYMAVFFDIGDDAKGDSDEPDLPRPEGGCHIFG